MNKEFITCLEHIIDLEKTRMAQKQLVNDMTDKANKLGLRNRYQQPVLKQAVLQKVEPDGTFIDVAKCIGGLAGLIIGIGGSIVAAESVLEFILIFIIVTVCFTLIGSFATGILLALFFVPINIHKAKMQTQKNYEAEIDENQRIYQEELVQYNMEVEADETRVMNEQMVKDSLLQSIEELKTQLRKTEATLTTYYDAAGIYDSTPYRNIVAVSYFHEYLASGICTELGGATGAYITYKNEMYSRMNIERLDTIINYLDQLHQDNQILNESLQYVASRVYDVSLQMDTLITQQKTVTDQLNTYSRQVDGQLEKVTAKLDDIRRQGALSLYMQSCEERNLDYLAWMEFYKARLK